MRGRLCHKASSRAPPWRDAWHRNPRSCATAVRSTEQPAPGDRSVSSPAEETRAAWVWEGLRLPLPRVSPDNPPELLVVLAMMRSPRGAKKVASPRRRWNSDYQGIGVEWRTSRESWLDRWGDADRRRPAAHRSPSQLQHTLADGRGCAGTCRASGDRSPAPCGPRTCRLFKFSCVEPHVPRAGPSGRGEHSPSRPEANTTTRTLGRWWAASRRRPRGRTARRFRRRPARSPARGAIYAYLREIGRSFQSDSAAPPPAWDPRGMRQGCSI